MAAERRELLKYLLQVGGARGFSGRYRWLPPLLLMAVHDVRARSKPSGGCANRELQLPPPPPLPPPPHCRLQDTQARGRDVLLPVGCSGYDEWLLDALSVDRVLKQLRSSSTKLDLINACVSTSAIGGSLAAAARRESLATPPRGSSSGLEAPDGVVDFRRLVSGSPQGTPSGGGGLGATSEAVEDEADSAVPQLRLRSLHVGEPSGRCSCALGEEVL